MSWQTAKLGEICTFKYGKGLSQDERDGGSKNVYGSNGVVGKHSKVISNGETIIVGRKGSIGEINWADDSCWPIDTTYYIDKNSTNQNLRWLYWRLKSLNLTKMNKSAAIPGLNREDAYRLAINLPPLPEQKCIAAILDKAAQIKAKRELAISKLDELEQSMFVEMFGDPVRNTKAWPSVMLGSVTRKLASGATPSGGDSSYKTEGIALIRSMNVHDGEFVYKNLAFIDDEQAAKLSNVVVHTNDVLLNITGASVARVCRVPDSIVPARVNQHVMIIRPTDEINPIFLERQLLTVQMKRKLLQVGGTGATREAITKAQASELNVICPPIAVQRKYAEVVERIEKLKSQELGSLDSLQTLSNSIQHQAFTTGFSV